MNYEEYREKLKDFLFSKLESDEAIRLRTHMESCDICKFILEDVRSELESVERIPEEPRMFGDYRIMKKLRTVELGEVFRAVQLDMDRNAELTILLPGFNRDEEFVKQFLHIANIATEIDSPFIIRVLEAGEFERHHFIATERIESINLTERLATAGAIPAPEAVGIMVKVVAALVAIHKYSIIHGQTRPENILIGSESEVRLTGICLGLPNPGRRIEQLLPGEPTDRFSILAPEQVADGGQLSVQTDIYLAGATLLQLVTGQTLFPGRTGLELKRAILEEPIELDSDLLLSARLRSLITKCIEKSPGDRYKDCAELLTALEQLPEATQLLEEDETDILDDEPQIPQSGEETGE